MSVISNKKDRKAIAPVSRLPTSPVDLLRPDKISFYTLDSNGQVVLRRMTEKEIQSLIAAGGGQLPVAISEPQKITESTGMKVKIINLDHLLDLTIFFYSIILVMGILGFRCRPKCSKSIGR